MKGDPKGEPRVRRSDMTEKSISAPAKDCQMPSDFLAFEAGDNLHQPQRYPRITSDMVIEATLAFTQAG